MASDQLDLTQDGSVDVRGKPAVKAKTGGWRACYLIIGYEAVERMAFAGIWANLVVYLTKKLHEGTVSSSRNVTNWIGTLCLTPLLGAYVADTYLGRFRTFAVFSIIYIVGMAIMILAVTLKSLRPPECPSGEGCERATSLQIGIFYFALYLLAVGAGGTRPNISTFGADQFDDFDPKEKSQKASFFNWWILVLFGGSLFGQTFLVYVEDHIGWGVASGIIIAGLIVSYVVFMIGTPIYRYKAVSGSPLRRMAKVICRMIQNWEIQVPSDESTLHEVDSKEYLTQGRYPIAHTKLLRIFDKAAVQNNPSLKPCTVTDVEETKLIIRVLPIWATAIFPTTLLTQSITLFVKQATTLDRHMGPHFEIPAASIVAFLQISLLISLAIYDRFLVRIFRRFTGNPRGITILQRMGIGLILYTICMLVAMLTEMKRRDVIGRLGLEDNSSAIVPRTVFTLVPQYFIMGMAEAFLEVARMEFFYDQAPESMRSLGTALYLSSSAFGAFLSSVVLTIVSDLTGRHGHKSWVLNNVNASRFDYYFALLAGINFLNYFFFLFISSLYTYKRDTSEAFGNDSTNVAQIIAFGDQNSDGIESHI
ncbi:hypothetical protein SUGI_0712010 [Cryptomeria japonica]|uniref:protein NRT1/ PTR FAMILY 5.2-like n=1 Tax=Cryptomeria japonica TaxID=3369 RepID=UPI0024148F01|nr:protein NRT1/ PTR FAMILY 5.2-like [Cryptomeria japonica]GLJ35406.1 hypothetical protein SUGI_0712010 [Cryptomeria japonica]